MGDSNNPLWFNIKKLGLVRLTVNTKKKHHNMLQKVSKKVMVCVSYVFVLGPNY